MGAAVDPRRRRVASRPCGDAATISCLFLDLTMFLFLGWLVVVDAERDSHQSVAAQVLRALRRRLRLLLDGGRRGVREAPPPVAWPAPEI